MKYYIFTIIAVFYFVSSFSQDHLVNATSSIETNYYASVYGYHLEVINDSVYVSSKQRIKAIKIMSKHSVVSYWHNEYNKYNMVLPLNDLAKGNYIIALKINQSFIINVLNHHSKSLKP